MKTRLVFHDTLFAAAVFSMTFTARANSSQTAVQSPDGRNSIILQAAGDEEGYVRFTVRRDGSPIIRPSRLGPMLAVGRSLGAGARIVDVQYGKINERFQLPWGKTSTVTNRCSYAFVTLRARSDFQWEVELRAYDDGVAFRYRLPRQEGLGEFVLRDEVTQFDVAGEPTALFNTLDSFTTSRLSRNFRRWPGMVQAVQNGLWDAGA